VDDPFEFGQIAAANSLSDVYAMGGKPVTAMSIVCFPQEKLGIEYLQAILAGGMDKLNEANCALIGGHSVDDPELKYGLSVTGIAHPNDVRLNNTPKEGDILICTKPVGTGIINNAWKADLVSKDIFDKATHYMKQLNKLPIELSKGFEVSACTDVTGFGLAGHLAEMIDKDKIGFEIDFNKIAIIPSVLDMLDYGMVPAGTFRNREYRKCDFVDFANIPLHVTDVLFDPQTSGGLILAINENQVEDYIKLLKQNGIDGYIFGRAKANSGKIEVLY
jgi:selenide,water dikinase